MKASAGCGLTVFLLAFATFWSALTLTFDYLIGHTIYMQMRAESFPRVAGAVTASDVRRSTSSDGTTYRAEIEFTYEVDGATYHGDQYRFGSVGTSNHASQQRIVQRYPVGATVDVYFDPEDPATAVLEHGVGGMDMFLVLFMTPFNMVMLLLWVYLVGIAIHRVRRPPAGGAPIMERAIGTVVRLPRISPLVAAGVAALVVSFLSIFVVAFATGMDPSMQVITGVWIAVIVSAVAVFLWRKFKVGSGAKDLVIDDQHSALVLPQTFGRNDSVTVLFERVDDLRVEEIEHVSDRGARSHTYAPTLFWRDESGKQHSDKLAEWYDEASTADLAHWIRSRIGLDDRPSTQ